MARTSVRGPVPEELEVRPLALYGIEGHLRRCNDAVFQPALPSSAEPSAFAKQRTLVFFGGDIQNLSHLMDHTDRLIDYRKWCLEATALRLGSEFPSCHVVVIKPSRVVFDHISCFDNFVESNYIGIPKHYYHYMGLMHLEKLLKTISRTLRQMDPDVLFKMLLRTLEEEKLQEKHKIENGTVWQYENMPAERKRVLINWQKKLRLHKYPLTLVAFSKGCVVLNQFLYEFHYARGLVPNHLDTCLIERIRDMYWLDSGNCGHNVYLTSMGLLKTLAVLEIIVHVHVSMYMTEDENRPWIGKQFNEFIKALEAFSGNVIHFRHVSPTEDLTSHFKVLLHFKYVEKRHIKNINSPKVRRQRKLPPVLEVHAPVAPAPVRVRPRKQPDQSESIGLCLVNPHDSPYLGLQIAMQKPGFTLKATQARLSCPPHTNLVQTVPSRYGTTISPTQMPATSAQQPISAQTPVQTTTYTQMPSTPALPSLFTPSSTPAQKPSPSVEVWSSDLLPKNHKNYTVLLLNEVSYTLKSKEEAIDYITSSYCEIHAPVVALPSCRNPLRVHVYSPDKETYVPAVYNHHYVVNKKNKNYEGEELSPFFGDEEPPRAADGVDLAVFSPTDATATSDPDPGRATSSSNSVASRSGRNATGLVGVTPGPRSDVSSPDSYISDSTVSNPDSYISGSDSDASISDADSYMSGSASDALTSDSDLSSNSGTSSPVSRHIGSRSGLGFNLSGSSLIDTVSDILAFSSRVASASGPATSASGPDASDSGPGSHSTSIIQLESIAVDQPVLSQRATPRSASIGQPDVSPNRLGTPRDPVDSQSTPPGAQVASSSQDSVAPRAGISGARVVDDELATGSGLVTSDSGPSSHSTDITQLESNTLVQTVLSQRATPRSTPIAQPDVSQNQVATPRDHIGSQSSPPGSQVSSSSQDYVAVAGIADQAVPSQSGTPRSASIAQPDVSQNQVHTPRDPIDSQSTPPGAQVARSSQDLVAPRAGTSGTRVRTRDEPLFRYNLRKRIKRSYDENILHIQFQ